jgi:hypothetical protein
MLILVTAAAVAASAFAQAGGGNCVSLGTPKPATEYSYRLTDSRGPSFDYTNVWEEVTRTGSRVRATRSGPGGGTSRNASRHRIVDDVSMIEETVQNGTAGGTVFSNTTTFAPGVVGDPFGRACAGRSWPIASVTATNRSGRGTFSTKSDAGELKILGIGVPVTVPAGTFQTVHYTRTTSSARGTVVDEYWKSIEHGVTVRHQSAVAGVRLSEELQSIR